MIDKYELTAKLVPVILKAFREGYGADLIEDCMNDAFAIAKAQYHKEVADAKRKNDSILNDRDKMKQLLLAGMKAMRSLSEDETTKNMTDEYLEGMLTDEVLNFASEISKSITNVSNELFTMGASVIQEKGKKNDSNTTHISNNNTDSDSSDSYIIGEWLKHQHW